MVSPAQGDIFWAEAQHKRRPVLVVTRSEAIPVLDWIIVAPVTRTIRGIPTEILISADAGLNVECVASFDNLQPIRKTFMTEIVGTLPQGRSQICKTLSALADC